MGTVVWHRVRIGEQIAVRIQAGQEMPQPRLTRFVLPGSFDPVHRGHQRMADWVQRQHGCAVEFEISIENVDKPPLTDDEIARRMKQFSSQQTVWITRAPTFVQKTSLFARATFLVGADTMLRVANPQYYEDRQRGASRAVEQIRASGCRFLVFGRAINGDFRVAADLALPSRLAEICEPVAEQSFREDVSSTELRRGPSPDRPNDVGDRGC